MTDFTQIRGKPGFQQLESVIVAVGDTIDMTGLRVDLAHCFVGVQFFADADGEATAVPGAGTVTVTVESINNPGLLEDVPDNVIGAPTPTTVSWAANTKAIRLVPSGITTATHYKAIFTGNNT